MSIAFCLAQTTAPVPVGSYVFIVVLTVAALGVAWAAGVFRRRSIVGPVRFKRGDSWGPMGMVFVLTVVAWGLTPPICARLFHVEVYEKPVPSTSPISSETTQPAANEPATIRPDALVKLSAVGSVAAFAVCVLATFAYRPGGLTRLGFSLHHLWTGAAIGLLAGVIVIPLVTTSGIITAAAWDALGLPHPAEHELLHILGDPNQQALRNLILLSAVVFAPLSEEMLFRGHVQTLLGRAFGAQHTKTKTAARWGAVLLTSALFAAVHPWWTMPPIFVLAVSLGYLYERTGNLWACVVLHALFNGTSTALFLSSARS